MSTVRNRTAQEKQSDIFAFQEWLSGGDSSEECAFLRQALAVVLREELTETQRRYLLAYYGEQMTMPEIAEAYGVKKSAVSRTIARGKQRLARALRYANRRLLHAPIVDGWSSNERTRTRKGREP